MLKNSVFTIHQDIDRRLIPYWYFDLKARNDRVLYESGNYSTKQKAIQGIASLKKNATEAIIIEQKEY